jgi:hypothetical protein
VRALSIRFSVSDRQTVVHRITCQAWKSSPKSINPNSKILLLLGPKKVNCTIDPSLVASHTSCRNENEVDVYLLAGGLCTTEVTNLEDVELVDTPAFIAYLLPSDRQSKGHEVATHALAFAAQTTRKARIHSMTGTAT